MLLVSPLENWGIGAIATTSSRPDFSKLFSRAVSKEGRLADGLETENCFFVTPGLTGAHFFLLFPGLDANRLQQRRPSFSISATYCTSPTSTASEMRTVFRGAPSPTANEATVSTLNQRSRVSFFAFLCDFLPARLQIGNYGASLYINSSPRVKPSTVWNRICRSDSSVQHVDPSLREKASLCEKGMTHKILHTRNCPLHLRMVNGNPIQRHSKEGMQLRRTRHH